MWMWVLMEAVAGFSEGGPQAYTLASERSLRPCMGKGMEGARLD